MAAALANGMAVPWIDAITVALLIVIIILQTKK